MDLDITKIGSDFILTKDKTQDIELLLRSARGQWYQHPEIGIDIQKLQNASVSEVEVRKIIREQLSLAGLGNVTFSLSFVNNKLELQFFTDE